MGVHNTYLRFVERLSWMQCLLLLSQNMQVDTVFQLPILGPFRDKPCRLNLKEMNFLKEFGAKKVDLIKVGSK